MQEMSHRLLRGVLCAPLQLEKWGLGPWEPSLGNKFPGFDHSLMPFALMRLGAERF